VGIYRTGVRKNTAPKWYADKVVETGIGSTGDRPPISKKCIQGEAKAAKSEGEIEKKKKALM